MYATTNEPRVSALTVPMLCDFKRDQRPIVALTAYDASFAAQAEAADIDVLLIGDSLGMVVQGARNTLAVTIEQTIYHAAAVARGCRRPLRIADMPFASYPDPAAAFRNAARLIAEGDCAMVKLEGGGYVADCIRYLVDREIPVCAHLGLTPQSVHRFGGFKVQGRGSLAEEALIREAMAVEQAGAAAMVLECVPNALAGRVRRAVSIPVIGIGAGADVDGQILVCHDVIGIARGRRPRFVKNYLQGRGSILEAFQAYAAEVRGGQFPDAEHSYVE